jgi:hypothetical protein
VQQMWRHHRDGVDIGALEQFLVVDDEIEAVICREWRDRVVIDVAARHDFETRTLLEASDDLLAPPAEAYNTNADHGLPFLAVSLTAAFVASVIWPQTQSTSDAPHLAPADRPRILCLRSSEHFWPVSWSTILRRHRIPDQLTGPRHPPPTVRIEVGTRSVQLKSALLHCR